MKSMLKTLAPPFLVRTWREIKRTVEDERNASRSAREVFSDIYRRRRWGRSDGRIGCSGAGSTTSAVVEPYVELIRGFLQSLGSQVTVVDLGCGDFTIGRRIVPLCSRYVGVDVVPELIKHHRAANAAKNVEFRCLDISKDELPIGDVCLVRQVLQHLSNREIAAVVGKLSQYRFVFVTEHQPTDRDHAVPNRDIAHGRRIRLLNNSGVYLDAPPFDLPSAALRLVLEVPGVGVDDRGDRGVIRTYQVVSGDEETNLHSPAVAPH
ncbi:MAG: class I SAM-dependent methyltransferase [Thermoguttaceae bacterium]